MDKIKHIIRRLTVLVIMAVFLFSALFIDPQYTYAAVSSASSALKNCTVISLNPDTVEKADFGQYDENFGTLTAEDMGFEYRFAVPDYTNRNGLFVLYNHSSKSTDESSYEEAHDKEGRAFTSYLCSEPDNLTACFSNTDSIGRILAIDFDLFGSRDNSFILMYGDNPYNLDNITELSADDFDKGPVILDNPCCYFRIEATSDDLYIGCIDLYINDSESDSGSSSSAESFSKTTVNTYRYIPSVNYDPKEGDTAKAPICSVSSSGKVTIKSWRTYTYHTFSYCKDQIENKEKSPKSFALTDPVDIANYFVLFNRIPPNFGVKTDDFLEGETIINGATPSIDDVNDLFGQKYARRVSEYTAYKAFGYAASLPLKEYPSAGKILYYEFDFDVDGTYTTDNRGVGRVIGFAGGFSNKDDDINTVVYTNDHYYTFLEYSNCGLWNMRFDAESLVQTGMTYSRTKKAKTLRLK